MARSSLTRRNGDTQGSGLLWLALRLTGAGLLIATGAIHLDLYLTGYRTIPTIGWLFLLQVITAFGLGAILLVWNSRLVAAAGAGFAIATLAGYLLSLRFSLFGFREIRTTAGIVAGIIEVATFAVLLAYALRPFPEPDPSSQGTGDEMVERLRQHVGVGRWALASLTALILVLLGLSLAAEGPESTSTASSKAQVEVGQDHGVVSADQCSWLHAVSVRTRYVEQVNLLWHLCGLLAAADGPTGRRARSDRQARNDRADGWSKPGHL